MLGMHWRCPACHGYVIQLTDLRALLFDGSAAEICATAQLQEIGTGPPCPSCARRLVTVPLPETNERVHVCESCDLLWADAAAAGMLLGLEPEAPPLGESAGAPEIAPPLEEPLDLAARVAQRIIQLEAH